MPSIDTSALSNILSDISISRVLAALITLLLCLIVIRIVMKLVQKVLSSSKLDVRAQKYILSGLKIVLYLLTVLILLGTLDVDMTSLVALLSVISLGITLAAEDILANMAGGLVILSAHPFHIGDFIEVSGTSGTVEEITLNYTKLITPDGLFVMLPNKSLADSQMTNYSRLGRRRITCKISASYDAPTERVMSACQMALDKTGNILASPAPEIYLSNFGESAIEYSIYCWTTSADFWQTQFALRQNVRTAFADCGVEMTYNHLNIHIVENRG